AVRDRSAGVAASGGRNRACRRHRQAAAPGDTRVALPGARAAERVAAAPLQRAAGVGRFVGRRPADVAASGEDRARRDAAGYVADPGWPVGGYRRKRGPLLDSLPALGRRDLRPSARAPDGRITRRRQRMVRIDRPQVPGRAHAVFAGRARTLDAPHRAAERAESQAGSASGVRSGGPRARCPAVRSVRVSGAPPLDAVPHLQAAAHGPRARADERGAASRAIRRASAALHDGGPAAVVHRDERRLQRCAAGQCGQSAVPRRARVARDRGPRCRDRRHAASRGRHDSAVVACANAGACPRRATRADTGAGRRARVCRQLRRDGDSGGLLWNARDGVSQRASAARSTPAPAGGRCDRRVGDGRARALPSVQRAGAARWSACIMRVLFAITHLGFLRNFESTLALLAQRGHTVHLVTDRASQPGVVDGTPIVERLRERFPDTFTVETVRAAKRDPWQGVSTGVREALNYWRYLSPVFDDAPKLRARGREQALAPLVWISDLPLLRSRAGIRALTAAFRAVERAIPVRREVEAVFDRCQADVLLVTPLLYFGSRQVDYVRCASRRGISSVLGVGSWDHLTTKGL